MYGIIIIGHKYNFMEMIVNSISVAVTSVIGRLKRPIIEVKLIFVYTTFNEIHVDNR